MSDTNPHIGSSFDDFLKDEGRYDEATLQAKKRVLAWRIEERRKAQKITESVMAQQMGMSRTELARVLNPANAKIRLDTLARAAAAVGAELKIELV